MFGAFIFALIGLPPFPGFWAKWELLTKMASNNLGVWTFPILLGSLLEAVYFLRWFGMTVKGESEQLPEIKFSKFFPVTMFLFIFIYITLSFTDFFSFSYYTLLPILAGTLLFALDWLPAKFKGFLSIIIVGAYSYFMYTGLTGIRQLFVIMFLIGGTIQIIGTLNYNGKRRGFYPFLVMLLISLGNLLISTTTLQFFFAWEIMAVSSYFLVLRGKKSLKASLSYIIFSLASGFLMLGAFALGFKETGDIALDSLAMINNNSIYIYGLLVLSFLIKSGSIGLHIWLPGAYGESEDDFSPIISSVVSKAGIFGLFLFSMILGPQLVGKVDINYIIGWLGVITAVLGALMAVFQEDIKKTLAYSSMGQIGYIILTWAMMSHLGWVTALYLSFNHILYKAMLFLAVAGVISRVNTRKMYEMGGLIKKMPASFISVLIAIIALSGVPPLSGFGGKWLIYTSLIEKGWYLQAGAAFLASGIAFLYLFRLIHTIFLGQAKTAHQNIKEASLFYLIPQYIFIAVIMGISMFPNFLLKPIIEVVQPYFETTLSWDGNVLVSSLGYWNGNIVMNITMVIFFVLFLWILMRVRAIKKVKQFNIVFAAERPDRPETTHYAHNFFAMYNKALGYWVKPRTTKFWTAVSEWTHSIAAAFRNIYTGNGQTYALHIIIFVVVLYFIMGAK